MFGENVTITKETGKGFDFHRTTPDGRQVGGTVHSGGRPSQQGTTIGGTFHDSKTGRDHDWKISG
jgi:hypothetical protein